MTPLQKASRAYVNTGSELHGKPNDAIYDALPESDQLECDEAMRAALLALAEAELPEGILAASIEDAAVEYPHIQTTLQAQEETVHSVLKAIANEGRDHE